jgi:hypothetical protein
MNHINYLKYRREQRGQPRLSSTVFSLEMPVIVVPATIWLKSVSHYRNRKNCGRAVQDIIAKTGQGHVVDDRSQALYTQHR